MTATSCCSASATALPPRLAPALIGHVAQGPLAGRTVFDALYDPRPAEVLLEALRTRARIGTLRFERDPGQEIRVGAGPAPADGASSRIPRVVYGDTFILKLLRRVVPGVNPDLELPLALAREGCPRVPAPTAWLQADLGGARAATARTRTSPRPGRAPALSAGCRGRLGAGAARAGQGRGLRRRGPGAGAGHGRGARGAGPARCPRRRWGSPQIGADGGRHDRAARRGRTGGAGAAPLRAGAAHRLRRLWPTSRPRAAPGPPSASTATCTSGSACARPPESGR